MLIFGQLVIVITGGLSFWMIHDHRHSWRLAACIFALIGQPFWMIAAWDAHQWGILLVDVLCTIGWIRGVYLNLVNYYD